MTNLQNTHAFSVLLCTVATLLIGTTTGHTKPQAQNKPWMSSPLIRDHQGPVRPSGFRLAGDRAGTLWISVKDTRAQSGTRLGNDQIAFNQIALVEAVRLLTSEASTETLVESEAAPASFVSRKVETVASPQGTALISWPFLLVSALASLLLWAAQRRRST